MAKISVKAKKYPGPDSIRFVALIIENVSDDVLPNEYFSVRVKEGKRVAWQSDYTNVGPLMPGEYAEVSLGRFTGGLFARQDVFVKVYGEEFEFSVGAFGQKKLRR